jgi:hypothetical protein
VTSLVGNNGQVRQNRLGTAAPVSTAFGRRLRPPRSSTLKTEGNSSDEKKKFVASNGKIYEIKLPKFGRKSPKRSRRIVGVSNNLKFCAVASTSRGSVPSKWTVYSQWGSAATKLV